MSDKKTTRKMIVTIIPHSLGMYEYSIDDKTVKQVAGKRDRHFTLVGSVGSMGTVIEIFESFLRKFDKSIQETPTGELFADAPPAEKKAETLPFKGPGPEAAPPVGQTRGRKPATEGPKRTRHRKPKPSPVSDAVDGDGNPVGAEA